MASTSVFAASMSNSATNAANASASSGSSQYVSESRCIADTRRSKARSAFADDAL